MERHSISEVAEQTGFTPSALRFYEKAGLISPARTAAGYRSYDAGSIDVLRFIARAKRLGLSLDEISDLVSLLGDRRCAPVQDRLRSVLAHKLGDAHDRITALVTLTAQLQRVTDGLARHTPEGPCDGECGCTADPADAVAGAAPLTGGAAGSGEVPIACSLDAGEVHGRIADWHAALRNATEREAIPGGVRLRLPRGGPIAPLAALIEGEQTCCQFLTFTLTVAIDRVTLDVTGPDGAQEIVEALAAGPTRRSGWQDQPSP